MELQSILHDNQSPVQENQKEDQAKKQGKETQNGQMPKRQQPEEKRGKRTKDFRESDIAGETSFSERSWGVRRLGR